MAVSMEVRIGHLCPKFLANTLVILTALQAAGTVPSGALQTLFDGLHHFLIFI